MTVNSLRLFETLPQNTWLSTNPKLLYHDPYLILIKPPPHWKPILNQTSESYKHPNFAPVMLVRLSHGGILPYLDKNILSFVLSTVYFGDISRESAFRIHSTQNTLLGNSG